MSTPEPARVTVIINETEGAARGYGGLGAYYYGATTKTLCVTPCVANLPYGSYKVDFQSTVPDSPHRSTTEIAVGPEPSIVDHAMGLHEDHPARFLVGWAALVLGLIAVGAATVVLLSNDRAPPHEAGYGIGGGAASVAIGSLLIAGTTVHQPGATTQWVPPDGKIFRR